MESITATATVGTALPGLEVKIVDPVSGETLPDRRPGELCARGHCVMLGYYNNEEATEAVLQDRWLRTGDLGRIDEDGNLYIVGRSKDVIIDSNGKNIYPDEIEELYSKSGFIKELSVVGLPDVEIEVNMIRAWHRHAADFCGQFPARLKTAIVASTRAPWSIWRAMSVLSARGT